MKRYDDDIQAINLFPPGKVFRLMYDSTTDRMRILAKSQTLFNELREVFTYKNAAAFFSQQHGYKGQPYKYSVNGFGFFEPGLMWDIVDWIKTQYGTGAVIAISKPCSEYIKDWLTPLSRFKNDRFRLDELAEDSGRNELIRQEMARLLDEGVPEDEIKLPPVIYMREYQRKGAEALFFDA